MYICKTRPLVQSHSWQFLIQHLYSSVSTNQEHDEDKKLSPDKIFSVHFHCKRQENVLQLGWIYKQTNNVNTQSLPKHSVMEAEPVLAASVLLGQVVHDRPLEEQVFTPHSEQGASPLLDTKPGGQLTERSMEQIIVINNNNNNSKYISMIF